HVRVVCGEVHAAANLERPDVRLQPQLDQKLVLGPYATFGRALRRLVEDFGGDEGGKWMRLAGLLDRRWPGQRLTTVAAGADRGGVRRGTLLHDPAPVEHDDLVAELAQQLGRPCAENERGALLQTLPHALDDR